MTEKCTEGIGSLRLVNAIQRKSSARQQPVENAPSEAQRARALQAGDGG